VFVLALGSWAKMMKEEPSAVADKVKDEIDDLEKALSEDDESSDLITDDPNTATQDLDDNKKSTEELNSSTGNGDSGSNSNEVEIEEEIDDEDADLERLLGTVEIEQPRKQEPRQTACGCRPRKVGKSTICCSRRFARTGFGIVGPHWFGPLCVMLIIFWASAYFIRRALHRIGPASASVCAAFMLMSFYTLIDAAYRDPGIVTPSSVPKHDHQKMAEWRFCDLCNEYQPPDGAHCPDCNMCIAGYDHHCVWMGTCIGKRNYKQFIRFNLAWLCYLLYAVFWVSVLGPVIYRHKKDS